MDSEEIGSAVRDKAAAIEAGINPGEGFWDEVEQLFWSEYLNVSAWPGYVAATAAMRYHGYCLALEKGDTQAMRSLLLQWASELV